MRSQSSAYSLLLTGLLLAVAASWPSESAAKWRGSKLAAEKSRQVAERSPEERAESFLRLARQAWWDGNAGQAQAYFERARMFTPEDPSLCFAYAHFLASEGRYSSAAGVLAEGMRGIPDWPRFRIDVPHLFPSPVRYEETIARVRLWLEQNPQSPFESDARFVFAYLLYFSSYRREAILLAQSGQWPDSYLLEMRKIAPEERSTTVADQSLISPETAQESEAEEITLASIAPQIPVPSTRRSSTLRRSSRAVSRMKPSAIDAMRDWFPTVTKIAQRHRVDPKLVAAVIHIESRFNPRAVSPAGARGMMQLIPATASRFGVRNIYDPHQNMEGGVKYLRYLLDMFNGNVRLALAAYNAGEQNVVRHGGVPPFSETQNYVREVYAVYQDL